MCSVPGCTKRARDKTSGLCAAHGSGKRMREALSYGFRCTVEGCNKPARDATYGVCCDHRAIMATSSTVTDGVSGSNTSAVPIKITEEQAAAGGDAGALATINNRECLSYLLSAITVMIPFVLNRPGIPLLFLSLGLKLQSSCETNDVEGVRKLCSTDPQLPWHRRLTDGSTPLHIAILSGSMEVANYLIQQPGVDVDSKNDGGETPLHLSATMGDTRMATWLFEHGANVNAPDSSRTTPLQKAVMAGSAPVVDLLLSRGAVLGMVNVHGDTALHLAVRRTKGEDIVKLLLKAHADVNACTRAGQTVLDVVPEENSAVKEMLIAAGAKHGTGPVSHNESYCLE